MYIERGGCSRVTELHSSAVTCSSIAQLSIEQEVRYDAVRTSNE